ncbi:MAG: RNA polymerase sigma factor SigF [Actinobacteria bacterium]|nr:RNA polymerase sigma factor SigF [Actinomycetota bacterium]MCL5887362.1 RNA polymerase sigma factor SigF [Actinomycetota bacterium]
MPSIEPADKATQGRLSWNKRHTRELFRRYHEDGDELARDELVSSYLKLVRFLASKFRNRGEPIDDLVQVGTIGLIKAIDRFDVERNVEFTTYATPTIVGEIKRHFRDKGWAIRIPRRLQELYFKVNRAIETLTQDLQRSPTIAEIAAHLEVTTESVLEAMETSEAYTFMSLDGEKGPEGGASFSILEYIGEDDALMKLVEDRDVLSSALKKLDPSEQGVLYWRFYRGMTQSEIAAKMGLSQMQVSRILRRSLRILRENIMKEG